MTANRRMVGQVAVFARLSFIPRMGELEMSMILKLQREGDLLRAMVFGEFSLEQAKKNFLEVLDAAILYGSRRVLFDGRCVTGFLDGPDRFFYGEFAAHSVWDRIARGEVKKPPTFAFVLTPPIL